MCEKNGRLISHDHLIWYNLGRLYEMNIMYGLTCRSNLCLELAARTCDCLVQIIVKLLVPVEVKANTSLYQNFKRFRFVWSCLLRVFLMPQDVNGASVPLYKMPLPTGMPLLEKKGHASNHFNIVNEIYIVDTFKISFKYRIFMKF